MSSSLSKEKLEKAEEAYFAEWSDHVRRELAAGVLRVSSRFGADSGAAPEEGEVEADYIQPFEQNLDVWRQLWRTLEQSDVILIVADARNPLLHIPLSVVRHIKGASVTGEQGAATASDIVERKVVLVLTKVDLISPSHLEAWKAFLSAEYPGYFDAVLPFTKQPHKDLEEHEAFVANTGASFRTKRLKSLPMKRAELARAVESYTTAIVDACLELGRGARRSEEEAQEPMAAKNEAATEQHVQGVHPPTAAGLTQYQIRHKKSNQVTIGCVGHPNVGKSSVLNAIIGTKKLSVSRTAGHTKHIQHIFLTDDAASRPGPEDVATGFIPEGDGEPPEESRTPSSGRGQKGRGRRAKGRGRKSADHDVPLSKTERKAQRNELRTSYRATTGAGPSAPSGQQRGGRGAAGGRDGKDTVAEESSSEEEGRGGPPHAPSSEHAFDAGHPEEAQITPPGAAGDGEPSGEQICVMDCPGLIFPMLETPLHVLETAGLLPIAQVRESFSAVRFLMEHIPLEKVYGLVVPEWYFDSDDEKPSGNRSGAKKGSQRDSPPWTPMMVLEAFAEKRNYILPRSGTPDVHRAGLEIVRDCVDGVVCLAAAPPARLSR